MRICIVGGGPGGLSAARALSEEGLDDYVILEKTESFGGIWNGSSKKVFTGLRLNTSRWMTEFSNVPMDAEEQSCQFLMESEFCEYINKVAAESGVLEKVRFGHNVISVRREGEDFKVVCEKVDGGSEFVENFDRIIFAVGVNNSMNSTFPSESLKTFRGTFANANNVRGVDVAGKQVGILGGSNNACEISSAAVARGAAKAFVFCRSPAYLVPKMVHGIPVDALVNTRRDVYLKRMLPESITIPAMQRKLQQINEPFSDFPRKRFEDPSLEVRSPSVSSTYMEALCSGKVVEEEYPWSIEETGVVVSDGKLVKLDVLIECTGFRTTLPFLEADLQKAIVEEGNAYHLNLYRKTFHPDELGIAFVGLIRQTGSSLPIIELQSRWIAGVFSGRTALPSDEKMREFMHKHMAFWGQNLRTRRGRSMGDLMEEFAEQDGCRPRLWKRPYMLFNLLTKPLYPVQYRLDGPHADPTAEERLNSYYARDQHWFSKTTEEGSEYQQQFSTL